MARTVTVDIISDTVCPWCYVGKKRLEKALQLYKGRANDIEVVIKWHPYQLNPDAPVKGISKQEFYQRKFGSRASSLQSNMANVFRQEGLQYNVGGLTGNTFNSHRLISLAGKNGPKKQNALVEELFRAYFSEAKYINDEEVLLEAAQKAGIPDAGGLLADPSVEAQEVQNDLQKYRGRISGVPHFIIDNRFELSGAQDPSTFASIFDRL